MYVIIVGCGRVGSGLAKILTSEGHDVVVIDRSQASLNSLGKIFNGITYKGNGFDLELLKTAGIEKADALCAVTNSDNTNLVAAQIAKKLFGIPKVIARVYDPSRAEAYRALGLDIISGAFLVAAMIRDKIIESRFSSYLIESGELGVLEIKVDEKLKGKLINQINMYDELVIVTVRKPKGIIIPSLDTKVEEKDTLIAVVKTKSLEKIRRMFGL